MSYSLIAQNRVEGVPEWAKKVVWYQIFPERFSNGDKTNDPAAIDMKGAWPYSIPADWQIHPRTSDWYKLQPWETGTGYDFYWNAGLRRYGGDLQGIINKLDYIQDLGITAIYLNPIFESPSLHKYDASMYHHIDNNFGPDPDLDREIWKQEDPGNPATWKWTSADSLFLQLIKECHNRNIKIIIDGVRGDPNIVGKKAFGLLFRTYFSLGGVPKRGPDFKAPRARWPVDPGTPASEWTGLYAMPVPYSINELPARSQADGLDVALSTWDYGEVAEVLHVGPYSAEQPTIARLLTFIADQGRQIAGIHEEEYLRGPGMLFAGNPDGYLTLIRYPVRRKAAAPPARPETR